MHAHGCDIDCCLTPYFVTHLRCQTKLQHSCCVNIHLFSYLFKVPFGSLLCCVSYTYRCKKEEYHSLPEHKPIDY